MSWDSALARLNTAVRDTFGKTVIWRKVGEDPVSIVVVPSESKTEGEATPPNYQSFWVKSADAATISRGDILSVDGVDQYRVVDVDPDGGNGIYITCENIPTGWALVEGHIEPITIIAVGPLSERPDHAREGDGFMDEATNTIWIWVD